MTVRKFVAELVGTALLVIVGVGVATLSFGFKLTSYSTARTVVRVGMLKVVGRSSVRLARPNALLLAECSACRHIAKARISIG